MMTTTSIGGLYVGRLFIGLANGMFMTFSQLYIQECSPAQFRGLMLSAFQFWTSIGTLVGTIVDNYTAPLTGKAEYLIPLGLIYIVSSSDQSESARNLESFTDATFSRYRSSLPSVYSSFQKAHAG